jgi:hypothetical protein
MAPCLDRTSFAQLEWHLHDHSFDLGTVKHDARTGVWQVAYSSEVPQSCSFWGCLAAPLSLLRLLLRANPSVPAEDRMDCILTVTCVKSWQCEDRARIQIYTLNRVGFDPQRSRLCLVFCEDCEVFLEVGPDFTINGQWDYSDSQK